LKSEKNVKYVFSNTDSDYARIRITHARMTACARIRTTQQLSASVVCNVHTQTTVYTRVVYTQLWSVQINVIDCSVGLYVRTTDVVWMPRWVVSINEVNQRRARLLLRWV